MNKDIITKVSSEIIQTVSSDTGELMDVNVKTVKILTKSDTFSLVYASFWNILIGGTLNKADVEVTAYLIKHYGDNTPFTISSYIKKELAKSSGKSETTYNNCTRVLLKNEIIFKLSGNTYKLNPKFVFKGSSSERNKLVIEMKNY
tara:strand:- start:925 stop:1362 length:438 start_codon:yes stop_codon:yes gene_type:complete